MIKNPNYLTSGRAVSGLNVDEPKFSSLRTLRVELKERKCDICWFKLCSSTLTITSLTRSDLFTISTRTLCCSSRRTFGFQNGAVEIEQTRCSMLENLNPQVTGNCDLVTSTDYANFFSSYHWCWKLKNYCEAINITIAGTTQVLQ